MKMKNVKVALKELNRVGFGDVEVVVIQVTQELKIAQDEMHKYPGDPLLISTEKVALEKLRRAKQHKNSLLHQKAKINWLK